MQLYSELKSVSQSNTTIEDVKIKYLAFLEKYFDHENQFELTGKIVSAFKSSFTNGAE